jgi:hypothetical protein
MINKTKLILIAAIAASSIALPAAAQEQSAFTTGTAASRAAAGYPSPYGSGLYRKQVGCHRQKDLLSCQSYDHRMQVGLE